MIVAPIRIEVKLRQKKIWALVDSGSSGNFIHHATALAFGFPTQAKKGRGYPINTVDGSPVSHTGGSVITQTIPMEMITPGGHIEVIVLDITNLGEEKMILGMPWLVKHNPTFDWSTRTIELVQCKCPRLMKEPSHSIK